MTIAYTSRDLSETGEERLKRIRPRGSETTEFWAKRVEPSDDARIKGLPHAWVDEDIWLEFFKSETKSTSHRTLKQTLSRCRKWWEWQYSTPLQYANTEDVDDFIHYLRSDEKCGHGGRYARDTVSTLSKAFAKGIQKEYLEAPNPFKIAIDEHNWVDNEDKQIRRIETYIHEGDWEYAMDDFVRSVRCPKLHCAIMLMTKHLKRAGEVLNVDLDHIYIPKGWWSQYLSDANIEMKQEVKQFSNEPVIYFSSAPEEGAEYNGEVRMSSAKSKEGTIHKIDDELVTAIHRCIAVRPAYVDTRSLLVTQHGRNSGDRWSYSAFQSRLRDAVQRYNEDWWTEENKGSKMNVTPHYFRHWGNEHYRSTLMNSAALQFLRGDKGAYESMSFAARFGGGNSQSNDYDWKGGTNTDVLRKTWENYLQVMPMFYR